MTAASAAEAEAIADALVAKRLAACVQILPQILSVYRWQGKIEKSSEVLLVAKTESQQFAELEKQVRALHSYEIPEIVAVPAAHISEPYRDWLSASLDNEGSD